MNRRRTVLLFDVDGTLVSAGGAGRRALERAAAAVYGPRAAQALAEIQFDGMTDRLIVREACRRLGCAFDLGDCDRVFAAYVPALLEELTATVYEVHEGVVELLAALRPSDAVVGLGTGNIRQGAMAKLARGGLERHFAFGGFAEDGESREEILRAGLARAREHAGGPVEAPDAIVIGDTPRDVGAARAIGCVAVGVATGRFDREELLRAGAHRVFETLADDRALAVLEGSERIL